VSINGQEKLVNYSYTDNWRWELFDWKCKVEKISKHDVKSILKKEKA